MKTHGPWRILSTTEIYRDRWIDLTRDDVIRPDGKPGTHLVLRMKQGVSVLPVADDGTVYLTDEFHYAIGRHSLEVVSGGIEEGEEPLETARRELQEELGLAAEDWTPLGIVDPFTTISVSPTALFLARRLSFVESNPEGTEQIRRAALPLEQAVEQVMDGTITHAPSCVAILKAARLLLR